MDEVEVAAEAFEKLITLSEGSLDWQGTGGTEYTKIAERKEKEYNELVAQIRRFFEQAKNLR